MENITLNCIFIRDSETLADILPVEVAPSDTIAKLKDKVYREGPWPYDSIKLAELLLWRPKDDLPLETFPQIIEEWKLNRKTRKEENEMATILQSPLTVESQFHLPLSSNSIHVVVQLPANEEGWLSTSKWEQILINPKVLGKRKFVETDGEVNEGLDVVERWRSKRAKAELPTLSELTSIADRPLSEEEKIPLSKKSMISLISHNLDDICTAADVAVLFRASNHESDMALARFYTAVISHPPSEGTEDRYHSFWDRNINDIIEVILPNGKPQRNSNRNTATKALRPDYAFLLRGFCPFRGEEKAPNSTGDPKAELAEKLEWVYDPAPYVLGYYATGTSVALAAISRPPPGKTQAVVHDIVHADLRSRKARIVNLRRLINLTGILHTLADIVRNRDAEFEVLERDNSTVEIVSYAVIKTYKDTKRVEHLQNVYALLEEKKIPNTDRPLLTEGGRIILSPRGISRVPKTQQELLGAVACVLETLQVIHAIPLFHRDIRWPNVMRRLDDDNRWFLIDWEDAASPPTFAQPSFAHETHSPTIFVDGHGAEVDMWGVGGLILRCEGLDVSSELRELGRWLQAVPAPSAQEALNKVKELTVRTYSV
ncbi:hypothetical protein Clacol_000914 [Clathrus columnatus]|uniref:Crinkler effector protein N-terminal domain-containing protein n=1 Tax=Clathrus columnatus TaxID=1419009 RepID=A0AAV5A264_9AGAM|nr:hypothetical protein Clacol_000914 [Clathrus columnatus]